MDKKTFNKIREIVYEKSGISLGEQKESLVTARVNKRMRKLSISDSRDYLKYVMEDESGEELVSLLDVISTNVTYFYREADHFDFLTKVFSEWVNNGQKRFRFWCAAASTGEEPYTMAITLLEVLKGQKVDLKILGTDISTVVLDVSREAVYDEKRIEPVPRIFRTRYFHKVKNNGSIEYAVNDSLKKLFVFKRLNLSKPPFPMKGPMDVIFCRNVMIYFDKIVRKKLVDEMYRLLKPGGYLMLGHSESLTGIVSDFKAVKPSVYIK